MPDKSAQMEKEVPVDIKEVGDKEEITDEVNDIKEDNVLGDGLGIEDEKSIEQEERVEEVKDSIIELKNILTEFLQASFKIELSEDDMKLLLQKILGVVNVFVADTTTDRVEDIAGDIVQTTSDQLKKEKQLQVSSRTAQIFGDKYPTHPQIMDFLIQNWTVFLSFDDAVDQIGSKFNISEDDAIEAVTIMEEEMGELEITSVEVYGQKEEGWEETKCPQCGTLWDNSTTVEDEDDNGNVGIFPKCQKCGARISDIALSWKEDESKQVKEERGKGLGVGGDRQVVKKNEEGWEETKCPTCGALWDNESTIEDEDDNGNVGVFPKCQKCGARISDIALSWKE